MAAPKFNPNEFIQTPLPQFDPNSFAASVLKPKTAQEIADEKASGGVPAILNNPIGAAATGFLDNETFGTIRPGLAMINSTASHIPYEEALAKVNKGIGALESNFPGPYTGGEAAGLVLNPISGVVKAGEKVAAKTGLEKIFKKQISDQMKKSSMQGAVQGAIQQPTEGMPTLKGTALRTLFGGVVGAGLGKIAGNNAQRVAQNKIEKIYNDYNLPGYINQNLEKMSDRIEERTLKPAYAELDKLIAGKETKISNPEQLISLLKPLAGEDPDIAKSLMILERQKGNVVANEPYFIDKPEAFKTGILSAKEALQLKKSLDSARGYFSGALFDVNARGKQNAAGDAANMVRKDFYNTATGVEENLADQARSITDKKSINKLMSKPVEKVLAGKKSTIGQNLRRLEKVYDDEKTLENTRQVLDTQWDQVKPFESLFGIVKTAPVLYGKTARTFAPGVKRFLEEPKKIGLDSEGILRRGLINLPEDAK